MKRHVLTLVASFGILVVLSTGCMKPGPTYQAPSPPRVEAADDWAADLAGGAMGSAADDEMLSHWWSTLNDAELTSLEDRAVQGNLDLQMAQARVRQARALRNIEKTSLYPTVMVGGTGSLSRTSDAAGPNRVVDQYSAGFDASWEPDIFGRNRHSIDAAEADLEATQESLRDVLVTLTAEVALNYVDLRAYQTRLSIAVANRDSQQETYELAESREQSGIGTRLEVEQARTSLESTRATIPTLQANVERAKNRLAVLLGAKPGELSTELEEAAPIPVTPREVAVGVPADLLRRRPDIRGAERAVAAQTARVGVATADLYPRFSLLGSIGLDAITIPDLFSVSGIATTIAGSIQHTVFDRRRLREVVNFEDAVLEQTLTEYESAVLVALEDVENALIDYAKEQVRRESLASAAEAAEESVALSRSLYGSGLRDFLDVLDAQRSLLSLQDQLATSDGLITSNLIRLYKALGGGWESANATNAPGAAPPPTAPAEGSRSGAD